MGKNVDFVEKSPPPPYVGVHVQRRKGAPRAVDDIIMLKNEMHFNNSLIEKKIILWSLRSTVPIVYNCYEI